MPVRANTVAPAALHCCCCMLGSISRLAAPKWRCSAAKRAAGPAIVNDSLCTSITVNCDGGYSETIFRSQCRAEESNLLL